MVIFIDKTTNRRCYLHIEPSGNDVTGEEIKLVIRNSITSLYKSNCVGGPLSLSWWSKRNLKTDETFLLSSYVKVKENLPSYRFLHHDIETGHKSWARLPLHGKFSYKPLIRSGILSSIIDAAARGWGGYQFIFDELGMAIGQCTEIFLAAFPSCCYACSCCQLEMLVAYTPTHLVSPHSWHQV
ncbi:hypothetical protein Cgig2_003161 [Carnegiea gigantea]|uniref:Uncharacterized protein n=1 Tax=Carnegiea gigantea TaxID=171969 RepID=A0A9Q1K2T0_9CARY|nr:hypothetical protein Cgig2_003161 [Carnegiea gigantea]